MINFILLNEISESLQLVDHILSTLAKNPNLFHFVDKSYKIFVALIIFYMGYKLTTFIFKRIDKKRCDLCQQNSLNTIAKAERTFELLYNHIINR